MDFFEAQDQARSRSKLLITYFVLAVMCIVAAVYFAVTAGVFYYRHKVGAELPPLFAFDRFAWTAGIVTALVGLGSFWKIARLRRTGGAGIAQELGGRRLNPSTRRAEERKLMNIVEEMAIASGVPVPEVYVLDDESAINAFAAGFEVDEAAIGVTRGAIEQLDRDELQGVIAHEFSHILNGDMRLSTKLSGWIFGIVMLTLLGRGFWALIRGGSGGSRHSGGGVYVGGGRGSRRSGGNGGGGAGALIIAVILVAVLITVIGFIGEFFARLIQAAVSRQREYLADAAAVQFTRNPEGIGHALRRIGGMAQGSRIEHSQAGEFAHAFFSKSFGGKVSFLATHPPLPRRIRQVLPGWSGDFLKPRNRSKPEARPEPSTQRGAQGGTGPIPGVGIGPDGGGRAGDAQFRQMLTAGLFMRSLGQLREQGQAYAAQAREALHASLPDILEEDGRSPDLLLALLLQEDAQTAAKQREILDEYLPGDSGMLFGLARRLGELARGQRLMLLELVATRLPDDLIPPERENFALTAEALIQADGRVAPFELACLQVVRRRLFKGEDAAARTPGAKDIVRAACVLATRLAAETPSSVIPDAELLRQSSRQAPYFFNQLAPVESIRFEDLDEAFEQLAESPLGIRQQFLQVCERIVAADEKASAEEVELLRSIAIGLRIPAAPIFPEPADVADQG
ncbi:MAG: M48 family metallopeptidase [Opitutales bacterium]